LIAYPIGSFALRWLEVILAERFGQAWQLVPTAEGLRLQLVAAEGAILFDTLCEGFTQAHSDQPFTRWDAEREGWSSVLGGPLPAPGVSDLPSPLIELRGTAQVIHYDILGLTYWMLARVEEIGRTDLDNHGRFPATASHAFKHGYLDRPVVDEWLYLLGQVIQRQWPNLILKKHKARTVISCDVDNPFALDGTILRALKRAMGDLYYRRSPKTCLQTLHAGLHARRNDYRFDPYRNAINFIMNVNEDLGNHVSFFLIPENTDVKLDHCVNLDEPRMRDLMKEIASRGHNIGIHPGYMSYRDSSQMSRSVETLNRVLKEESIPTAISGRQHYLRWDPKITPKLYQDHGIKFDHSVGYADCIGFRSGTSFDYSFFNAYSQQALKLRIQPLIVMEFTLIGEKYNGLSVKKNAGNQIKIIKDKCCKVNGVFSLLWHNHLLIDTPNKALYYRALSNNCDIKECN